MKKFIIYLLCVILFWQNGAVVYAEGVTEIIGSEENGVESEVNITEEFEQEETKENEESGISSESTEVENKEIEPVNSEEEKNTLELPV